MTLIGYTMMCVQASPKQLVRDVTLAEQAGLDFAAFVPVGHRPVRPGDGFRMIAVFG
jgi:hypothetical protein